MRKFIPVQKYALLIIKPAYISGAHDRKQVQDVEVPMGALRLFQNFENRTGTLD
jgi:hypothetical protein